MRINLCHEGYLAGLKGQEPDPDPKINSWVEYETGYLEGCADRERGITAPKYCGPINIEDLPIRKGMKVTIPIGVRVRSTGPKRIKIAGSTRQVKVHHIGNGTPAYVSWDGEFIRPVNPSVVWVGSGSYWHEADLNEVLDKDYLRS